MAKKKLASINTSNARLIAAHRPQYPVYNSSWYLTVHIDSASLKLQNEKFKVSITNILEYYKL